MDQCLDDIEAEDEFDALMYSEFPEDEDEFDALMYSEFPEDEDEETDPILSSFIDSMNNIERIGNVLMSAETHGGWHLDPVTGEYRKMQASLDEARRPYVMRAVRTFERTGIFA